MKFDWTNYYHLAKELADTSTEYPSEEATQRAAISRAYYAVLKLSEEFLIRKGALKPFKDEDNDERRISSHWRVIDPFISSKISTRYQIGLRLERLKKARELADYSDDFSDKIEAYLGDSLLRAKWIIDALKVSP
jgi:hypothetical protein